ncbi:siphovirus ReqiPepy6 Gp37-like family protein [Brevibacillus choshinensis]|uniref:siphovirus ReqiPepy6 Gp37-like family protein n=1 Tax=Brevibacillus choshinensis TaxID=54911 RepID=UPI002E1B3C2B|nr:siphovirus ReqiPepy6 Gp37-like family protein [Brevibacillus choshinensis]
MNPIRILSPDLTILGEIDDYESLSFTRRWHRPGEFEIHINRHKRNVDTLQKGNLVIIGRDTKKAGIIRHREITLDEGGKQTEVWKIVGQTLGALTADRIVIPLTGQSHFSVTDSSAETVMKLLVDSQLANPEDPAREIVDLYIKDYLGRGPTMTWQSRYAGLDEELANVSQSTGIGWGIELNLSTKALYFEIYQGRDLTTSQSVNPPVIFSPEFDSLKTQHYVDSDVNYRNVAIVAGQGEGELRTVVQVGTATGMERKEVFVDARDLPDTASLEERGTLKLNEMQVDRLLEGQILTSGPFKYSIDYDLGDIVTIRNKDWGVTMDARITEIKEIYEPSGFALEATFGNSFPTLISKIKQELGQMSGEIRR